MTTIEQPEPTAVPTAKPARRYTPAEQAEIDRNAAMLAKRVAAYG